MNINGKRNIIMILIAVLWLVIMFLGWKGMFVPAMVLSVFLMLLHMILGVAKQGKISTKFLIYPLLIWTAVWIVSFLLSDHYAKEFAGIMPTFSVGGFHPSFAPTFFLYYIGGMLTLTVGFVVFQDDWLSAKDWDDFLETVKKNKEEKNA